jgi:hypothetical protein
VVVVVEVPQVLQAQVVEHKVQHLPLMVLALVVLQALQVLQALLLSDIQYKEKANENSKRQRKSNAIVQLRSNDASPYCRR